MRAWLILNINALDFKVIWEVSVFLQIDKSVACEKSVKTFDRNVLFKKEITEV